MVHRSEFVRLLRSINGLMRPIHVGPRPSGYLLLRLPPPLLGVFLALAGLQPSIAQTSATVSLTLHIPATISNQVQSFISSGETGNLRELLYLNSEMFVKPNQPVYISATVRDSETARSLLPVEGFMTLRQFEEQSNFLASHSRDSTPNGFLSAVAFSEDKSTQSLEIVFAIPMPDRTALQVITITYAVF